MSKSGWHSLKVMVVRRSAHATLAAFVLVLGVTLSLAGCSSTPSGTGNNPDAFGITFDNNLNVPITLALCEDIPRCATPDYMVHLSPGGKEQENIGTGVRTTWVLDSAMGRRCITLMYRNYVDNPTIHTSSARRC